MKYVIKENEVEFNFTKTEMKHMRRAIIANKESRDMQTAKELRVAMQALKSKDYSVLEDSITKIHNRNLMKLYDVESEMLTNKTHTVRFTENWLDWLVSVITNIESYEHRKRLLKELIEFIKLDLNPNCDELKTKTYLSSCEIEYNRKEKDF